MPTVILKCKIRLFHDLKNAGLPSILAVNFRAIISCLERKRAIVTTTDDIVRPKRLSCINPMILEWLKI